MTDSGPPSSTRHASPRAADRDRIRAIVERLADGVVVVDRAGTILFANPAAERLFGRTAEDLVGSPFGFPLVQGEAIEIEIVPRGATDVVVAELRVVDGEWEGEAVDLISLRDVTDRRRAEERDRQLAREREARLEAEAASHAKSEFLATMSHELRTPLNAVLGYSELLELGLSGPITEPMREQLGRIRSSGKHLLALVNEILDLAKVEAGRLHVDARPASAREAVAAAVALIQPQAAQRGLRLMDEIGADAPPSFVGDDERVRQVLVNLLSNAVKFTPPGGRIRIALEAVRDPGTEARLLPGRRYVVFRIADEGVGIPAHKLADIFDPFVQADGGKTREREGSGLGLTISRRLARLMGGDLTVRSTPGKGSTFSLWLPADGDPSDDDFVDGAASEPDDARRHGFPEAGVAIMLRLHETIATIVRRVRLDPALAVASALPDHVVADHLATLLADAAVSLRVVGADGHQPSPLLADATEIHRLISDRHGRQRAALGWSESDLRREHVIVREEAARVIRESVRRTPTCDPTGAVALLNRFLDQAEFVAVRSLLATQALER